MYTQKIANQQNMHFSQMCEKRVEANGLETLIMIHSFHLFQFYQILTNIIFIGPNCRIYQFIYFIFYLFCYDFRKYHVNVVIYRFDIDEFKNSEISNE